MDVVDLNHFPHLSVDAPPPPRHLMDIVRAASAGDVGEPWRSALPCRRRPGRKACPGRLTLARAETDGPIRWRCGACGDDGVISNWTDSYYDLRRRGLNVVGAVRTITVDNDTAATLRGLQLLDRDCGRLVFAMRGHRDGAVLAASLAELDGLIGAVAAAANHEPNPRRQRRLDAAFEALTGAAGSR